MYEIGSYIGLHDVACHVVAIGTDSVLICVRRCHHEDARGLEEWILTNLFEKCQSAHPWHVEIEQHNTGRWNPVAAKQGECLNAIPGRA